MANFAFTRGKTIPEVNNGQTIERWNLNQMLPHTELFTGIIGLRFVKCNLVNCDLPNDAVLDDCVRCHLSYCSNVHPEWVEKFGLDECTEDCDHVLDTDEIYIDGILVDTIRHYQDRTVE